MSMRQLAKRIELDPSAVSLTFRGMRKMTLQEANQISSLLGVPVTEVIRQAGIDVSQDIKGVRLSGYIDALSCVNDLPKPHKPFNAPVDVPADGYAIQVRAPSAFNDGWFLIVSGGEHLPELLVDRLCVVALKGGKQVVGTLRRGYEPDTYNVLPLMPSAPTLENVEVVGAATVLWMRPH